MRVLGNVSPNAVITAALVFALVLPKFCLPVYWIVSADGFCLLLFLWPRNMPRTLGNVKVT